MIALLQYKVPLAAKNYCLDLYEQLGFQFHMKGNRKSKLGDFKYYPLHKSYHISVNSNLNPYLFLITYLHEVAHLVTHKEFGNRVLPHGKEWKINFIKLANPLLNEEVFPAPLLHELKLYFKNPAASYYGNTRMARYFNQLENKAPNGTELGQIPMGMKFTFNKRAFEKIGVKRTRVLCLELKTGQKYLIHKMAHVSITD